MRLFPLFLSLLLVGTHAQCYKKTKKLFKDMRDNANAGNEGKEYIICPDTTINVGNVISPFLNVFAGQFPIIPVGKNNVIKCGDDGARSNNCIIKSFFATSLVVSQVNAPALGVSNNNVSGTVIQGLTFTGTLYSPFWILGNLLNIGGVAVSLSVPGEMVFDDCAFVNLFASAGIAAMETNVFVSEEEFPRGSGAMAFRNSYFNNIDYQAFGFRLTGHNISIENSIFQDLQFTRNPRLDYNTLGIFFSLVSVGLKLNDVCIEDSTIAQTVVGVAISRNLTMPPFFLELTNIYMNNVDVVEIVSEETVGGVCEGGFVYMQLFDNFLYNCTMLADVSACTSTASTYIPLAV